MVNPSTKWFNKNAGYSLAHQVLMAGYGFILLLVLWRLMDQAEVGRWLLFVSAISLSDMILHGLLQTVLIRKISLERPGSRRLQVLSSNALLLAFSVFLLIVVISRLTAWWQEGSLFWKDFARGYGLIGLPMVFYNLSWWVHSGLSRFRHIFFQRLVYCSASALYIAVMYIREQKITVNDLVWSQFIGYSLASAFGLLAGVRLNLSWKYIRSSEWKSLLNDGKYTVGTMLGGSLLRNGDTFMIGILMNQGAVAMYSLAQKVTEIFEVALRSLAGTILPELSRYGSDPGFLYRIVFRRALWLTIGFILPAIVLFLNAPAVVRLFSGQDGYGASVPVLKVFMLYILLLPLDRILGITLEILHLPGANLLKTMVLLFVSLFGNYVALTYVQSLTMVAWSSIFALCAAIGVGFWLLKRHKVPNLSLTEAGIPSHGLVK